MPKKRPSKTTKAKKRAGSSTAKDRWGELLASLDAVTVPLDVHSIIQAVLRESYLEAIEDLRHFAEKVRHFNEQKRKIREALSEARRHHAKAVAGFRGRDESLDPLTTVVVDPGPAFDEECRPVVRARRGPRVRTRSELEAYIEGLEEQLASVGDDAQLANIDLQNSLQRQQQTLQMLSNVSKAVHETTMAIIRKIG